MKYFVMIVIALPLAACDPTLPSEVILASYNYPQDGEIPTEGTVTAQQDSQTQTTSGTISNEQDFDAVAIAQTVESDAERISANRAKYIVIDARKLPQRTDNLPNVVEYAIRTNNPVGMQLYKRFGTSAKTFSFGGCGKFSSTDSAQQAFLVRGGPKIDALGIDPDGDGFACAWDPRPFRAAVLN